jgi:hypothetical protein
MVSVRHCLAAAVLVTLVGPDVRAKDIVKANLLPEVMAVNAAAFAAQAAFGDPPPWQGYPRGDGPAGSTGMRDDTPKFGQACVLPGTMTLMKGLLEVLPTDPVMRPAKVIHLYGSEATASPEAMAATFGVPDRPADPAGSSVRFCH